MKVVITVTRPSHLASKAWMDTLPRKLDLYLRHLDGCKFISKLFYLSKISPPFTLLRGQLMFYDVDPGLTRSLSHNDPEELSRHSAPRSFIS